VITHKNYGKVDFLVPDSIKEKNFKLCLNDAKNQKYFTFQEVLKNKNFSPQVRKPDNRYTIHLIDYQCYKN